MYMSPTLGGQERVLDHLELELEMTVSHLMWVVGANLRFSARAVCGLNPLAVLQAHQGRL